MRKSRASHVKCDCGEKTSKCAHLQQTVDGHKETCCCNHGGRCTCSIKKELQPTLDTVPESDSEGDARGKTNASRSKIAARRRRANTVHSDGVLSLDQIGSKVASKHARASQKCGPYQLNRVNSANSASSLGAASDNLAESRVREAMGGRPRGGSVREPRRVKSEATSPLISSSGFQLNGVVPPLDLSAIEYPSYTANSSFDLFGAGFSPDHDGPMYSAGLNGTPVDWGNYDLSDVKRDNFAPSSYSQTGTQGFGTFTDFGSGSEHLPHLANTTSTSGDVSEVEDFMPGGDGDFDNLGAGSNFMRPSNNMMGNAMDISSIDYDSFYKNAEHGAVTGTGMSMVEDDPAFWMPNYNHEGIIESPDPLGPSTMNNFWEI
jgi:hypothetical protein